uniref:SbsA Ig-like domain-containing protein n=1 Tax=candidate division WWE3 bacterium TaxID=2053526 RepID=A0A7C4TJF0_UNCKA
MKNFINTIKRTFARINKKTLVVLLLLCLGLFFIFYNFNYYGSDAVVFEKSFPANGSLDVPVPTSIDIYFKNDLSSEVREKFYVRFLPGVSYKQQWAAPNHLRLIPEPPLLPSRKYDVTVLYDGNTIVSFSFTTAKGTSSVSEIQLPEIPPEDVTWLTENAQKVNESVDALKSDYPWYFKLPVLEDTYAIVFNNSKKQFRISIYSGGMTQEEKDQVLEIATNRLKTLTGGDSIRYGYYVLYRDDYKPNF